MPLSTFNSLSKTQLGVIALILANIIWGAALPIYKWTLEVVPPFTFVFIRFFIASLILLPFIIKSFKFAKQDLSKLIFAALISVSFQIPLLFFGLKLSPSINAPIIISAGPIILLVASVIFLKEKVSKRLVIGTLVSLFGVLLIILKPTFDSGFSGGFLGNFLIFLATICSVLQALVIKKLVKNNSILVIVFLTFLIGSLSLLPFVFIEYHSQGMFAFNSQALLGLSYAIIFPSILAHFFFFYGIKYIKVSGVGIFSYIDPVATILVAVPLLHEVITETYLIAALFVFSGIYIAERRINYHPFLMLKKKASDTLYEIIG